jgi:uncharacterized caspase-like protein
MRACWTFALAIWSVFVLSGPAAADKRVVLVIGNSAYQNVTRLANPANDAAAMTELFKQAKFDVVDFRRDLKASEMRRALRDFSDQTRDADVAVVYFAGHGIEVDGTNYLIPIDAVLERDIDIYDETFALDRVLLSVEPAKQLRLVILDACRDNPFAKTMKRTIGSRSIGRGLAKIEPSSPNTMIAFAAKAGSMASDGDSKSSPFTAALLRHIAKPGLDLRKAFGFVRDDVMKSTSHRQEPYVYGSLGGDDVPLVPAPAATGPQASPQDSVRRDYELALQLGTRDGWSAFLDQYPEGFYAGLAKGQLKKIAAEEARVAAAEKARLAEEEKTRLAAENVRKAEQDKAAAAARVAEDARIAAEKAKQIEEAKAAAAEQRRKEAEAAAAKALAEKDARSKALADNLAREKEAAEAVATSLPRKESADGEPKIAGLQPSTQQPSLSQEELSKRVQAELRRVGCLALGSDRDWNSSSQRSLASFNRHAGTKFDTKVASSEVLDAIKSRIGRVCPLVCEHGFRADGNNCVKIACRAGYRVNESNDCEKIAPEKKPVDSREGRERDAERRASESSPSKPRTDVQMYCGPAGCRPVRRGCRLVPFSAPGNFAQTRGAQGTIDKQEVCD